MTSTAFRSADPGRFAPLFAAVRGGLAEAAAGFLRLADAVGGPRALRLVEGPRDRFALRRADAKSGAKNFAEALAYHEGALALPPAAAAALRGARLEIVLMSEHFLIRPLEAPAQAAPFLDGVVRSQIDRLTPWRVTEAAFGFAPPEKLGADRIVTQIVATSRARLAAYGQALAGFGLAALSIAAEVNGQRVSVFSQGLGDTRRLGAVRGALGVLLAGAAIAALAAVCAWSYFGLALDSERERLDAAIAHERAVLFARTNGAEREGFAELNAKKRAALPASLAVETLSHILPDGTYLNEFEFEPGKIALGGLTDDAPGLIPLLETSKQFANAAFSAPTTRAPQESAQHFHIEAAVRPEWQEPR